MYRVAQNKLHNFLVYALTSSNINQFSKLFHCHNQQKICNNNITKDPTNTSSVSLHYLVKCRVLKATIENKTTSVTTHFYRAAWNSDAV